MFYNYISGIFYLQKKTFGVEILLLSGCRRLGVVLTLKEVLIWQTGTDLVSHSIALKASVRPASKPRKGAGRDSEVADETEAGETKAAEAYLADALDESKRALEVAEMSDELASESTTEAPAELEGIERISELFIGRDELCGVLEQESVAGSDEFEDEDAEEMARRIRDLEDLRGDWLPEQDDKDSDFEERADDEDSEQDDEDSDFAGPPTIALSRGRRKLGRAGPTRVRGSQPADSGQSQPQATAASDPASVPAADSGQPRPRAAAASDPPGPRPQAGVPRESASQWTWNGLHALKVAHLKDLCRDKGIVFNCRDQKKKLMEYLLQHRPAA